MNHFLQRCETKSQMIYDHRGVRRLTALQALEIQGFEVKMQSVTVCDTLCVSLRVLSCPHYMNIMHITYQCSVNTRARFSKNANLHLQSPQKT